MKYNLLVLIIFTIKIILLLFINILLINNFINLLEIILNKSKFKDKTVFSFTIYVLRYILLSLSIIFILDILNIKTSSLITILSTIIITIGLSLKSFLSNLSSGILIIFLELFKINDFIEIDKVSGEVVKIKLFTTTLKTYDNKKIIIPNNKFLSNKIIKYEKNINTLLIIELQISINKNINNIKNNIFYIIKKINIKNIYNIKNISINTENINENYFFLKIKVYVKKENLEIIKSKILEKIIRKKLINK